MAETFLESARDVVRNGFCSALSVADGFGDWLSDGGTSGSIFSLQTDIARNQINGLQGLFCNRAPGPPPQVSPGPEFTGGQCPFRYAVTVVIQRESTPQEVVFEFPLGPISGTRIESTGGGFADIILESADNNNNYRVGIDQRNGAANKYISHAVTSVVPRDVQNTDNCGDPGSGPQFPAPPGTETPISDDIVYGPPGAEVTIPVGLLFAPIFVTVNGELSIPFNINNPDFSLIGDLSLTNGDINFNFGGGRPDTEGCCLPPTVDDDGPGDEDDENDGETRTVIIGVLVNGTVDDSLINATQIGQPNGPDFYQPRIGNVIFQMRVSGQLFWTEPIAVKHPNQYIECPADFGAIRVLGNASPGVSLQLSPIRRKIPVSELP